MVGTLYWRNVEPRAVRACRRGPHVVRWPVERKALQNRPKMGFPVPFAGWMRYHLGLCTPGDGRCWIAVDGERHEWCDGGAMLFDETYVHWAVNDGERSRLILLCDIERPMRFRWAQALNHLLGRAMMTAASPPHEAADPASAGLAGRLSRAVIRLGALRRRLKAGNRNAYRAAVVAAGVCVGALLYLL